MWYVTEIAARSNTDPRNGIVQIVNLRDGTIWDYDKDVYDEFHYFENNALPVRTASHHVCFTPWAVVNFVAPGTISRSMLV